MAKQLTAGRRPSVMKPIKGSDKSSLRPTAACGVFTMKCSLQLFPPIALILAWPPPPREKNLAREDPNLEVCLRISILKSLRTPHARYERKEEVGRVDQRAMEELRPTSFGGRRRGERDRVQEDADAQACWSWWMAAHDRWKEGKHEECAEALKRARGAGALTTDAMANDQFSAMLWKLPLRVDSAMNSAVERLKILNSSQAFEGGNEHQLAYRDLRKSILLMKSHVSEAFVQTCQDGSKYNRAESIILVDACKHFASISLVFANLRIEGADEASKVRQDCIDVLLHATKQIPGMMIGGRCVGGRDAGASEASAVV
eukprot:745938-Hanusia_phi.AAC.2